MEDPKKRQQKMLLQWHITDRCNCQCTHCYQEADQLHTEPDTKTMMNVIEQFKELLSRGEQSSRRGQITVTGGEPFIRDDFFELIGLLADNKLHFDFAILTNGTLINQDIAKRLNRLQPSFVQVSVEGGESTHDNIRGAGNYRQTLEGIRQLVQSGVRVFISFTAHRGNFREFSQVAEVGRKLKVTKVWADRHIPMGQGDGLQGEMLTPEETQEFIEIMVDAQKRNFRYWFSKTKISLERSLQFLVGGGRPYHCTAGQSLLTVMPNGDVYPCRRMPIKIGNMMETSLLDIYHKSPLLRELRSSPVSIGCEECMYAQSCGGGLACLAYIFYRRHFMADPGCWYVKK